MKKLAFFLTVFLFCFSCNQDEIEKSYEIPEIGEKIRAFSHSKRCFDKSIKFILIHLSVRQDSLIVELSDTYPNLLEERFRCDTVIEGQRVIFTGKRISGFSSSQNQAFPVDIIEELKANPNLTFEEYTGWLYVYKKDKLVYQERPCFERN